MFIKLLKIDKRWASQDYYLSEVLINTSQIIYMSENEELGKLLREGKVNLGLNHAAVFTNLKLNMQNEGLGQITVVGDPLTIEAKMNKKATKILLRD